MTTLTQNNVVSLFPSQEKTTVAVDYTDIRAQAKDNHGLNTPNWNVPTCTQEDTQLSLVEQLRNKGVFYTVDGRENFTLNNSGEFVSTGKKTIYNVTSEKTLGVMAQGYKIAQNEQIFLSALREIDNAGIDTTHAFTRVRVDNDGQRVMAEIVFPETSFEVSVGDTVALSVSVINSFDGSGAFTIKMGAFRFVCANGMVSANKIIAYSSAHTASLNIGFATKTIASGMAQYNEDKESLLLQAKTEVNEQTVYEAIAMMNKVDLKKYPTYNEYHAAKVATSARPGGMSVPRHMALWNKYRKELGATQWALNNVLTHISTHGDKPEYSATQNIATRTNKEKLVSQALSHMLAA